LNILGLSSPTGNWNYRKQNHGCGVAAIIKCSGGVWGCEIKWDNLRQPNTYKKQEENVC
jgi:hypothetical protein